MAAALLFVSSPCPLVRTTCMHPRPTRSRIPSQGHGIGGEAERRLHFRHGPPAPQGKGDAVSRVWALSRQVLPTGRRLAGGSRGLGPWPDPPPPRPARHSCRSRPREDTQTPASVNPKRRRPPRLSGGDLRGLKAKEATSPQRRGPQWSQSERGPLASAEGASMVPKPRRPLASAEGLDGPKANEAPSPQRRGSRWSQSGGGPLASAEGASVVPKRGRPPRLSGGGLDGPKAKEAPSPQRRGPRWSQSEGGPLASAAGASMVPKRRRPPRLSGGSLDGPKAKEAPSP